MAEMELIFVCKEEAVRTLDPDGFVPANCYLTVSSWKEEENCLLLSRAGWVFKVSKSSLREAETLGGVSRGSGPFLTSEPQRVSVGRR